MMHDRMTDIEHRYWTETKSYRSERSTAEMLEAMPDGRDNTALFPGKVSGTRKNRKLSGDASEFCYEGASECIHRW